MTKSESGIEFDFSDRYTVVKFDDTDFYRQFATVIGLKAVDFVAVDAHRLILIEVKNCLGRESSNRWRICPKNQKRDTAATPYDVSGRDSLDIEIAQKAAGTLAVMAGSLTFPAANDCQGVAKSLRATATQKVPLILLLEGDFATHTRSNDMIYKRLQDSIRRKTKWMYCTPMVVNAQEFSEGIQGITARVLRGGTDT